MAGTSSSSSPRGSPHRRLAGFGMQRWFLLAAAGFFRLIYSLYYMSPSMSASTTVDNYSSKFVGGQESVDMNHHPLNGRELKNMTAKQAYVKEESISQAISQATSQAQSASATAQPLNILIFYPDDWGARDLQDENPILKTPTFTQLAKEGIRFAYNAVTTSICWISRATLFSGQYVVHHESTYLFRPIFAREPARWAMSWPALLQRRAGYWVGHIGKWQYQDDRTTNYKNKIFNFSAYFEGWIMRRGSDGNPEHIADLAKSETLRFLQNRPKDRPFAATVAFYPPKGIFEIDATLPKYSQMYQNVSHPEAYSRSMAYQRLPTFLQDNRTEARGRYLHRFEKMGNFQDAMTAQYATLTHIDSVCGEIIAELKKQGVYDNTMIIVTADNGEFHGAHALADKWYPYQESIRVPLIIKDPRMPIHKRGTVDDSFTLNIDLAETILGAAGLDAPAEMDGRDIADLYLPNPKSTDPWRTEFYYEFPNINPNIPSSIALVRKDWKYIDWRRHRHEELFNLQKDPYELNNVANVVNYKSIKQEMKHRLEELRHEVFWPRVPETVCDPLWPAGTDLSDKPNCSSYFPDKCCPVRR